MLDKPNAGINEKWLARHLIPKSGTDGLRIIDLKENGGIGFGGCGIIISVLKTLPDIDTFDLSLSGVNNSMAGLLADYLETNPRLINLYLNDNFIGDDGAKRLAKALVHNTRLRRLGLRNNNIRIGGSNEFVDMLATNKSLEVLTLDGNKQIPKNTASRIASILDDPKRATSVSDDDEQFIHKFPRKTIGTKLAPLIVNDDDDDEEEEEDDDMTRYPCQKRVSILSTRGHNEQAPMIDLVSDNEPIPVIAPADDEEPAPMIEPADDKEPALVIEPADDKEPAPVIEPADDKEPVLVIEPADDNDPVLVIEPADDKESVPETALVIAPADDNEPDPMIETVADIGPAAVVVIAPAAGKKRARENKVDMDHELKRLCQPGEPLLTDVESIFNDATSLFYYAENGAVYGDGSTPADVIRQAYDTLFTPFIQ